MSNNIFIKKFENEIDDLIKAREFSNISNRNVTKGDIIEETTCDLFSKYFPNRCGFGKGQIQDSFNNQSKEVDLIIYDKDNIPPICNGLSSKNEKRVNGFFPVESPWYTIEIKKKINNSELIKAFKNMESVKKLRSRSNLPVRMLFAYDSDLKSSIIEEFERYKKIDKDWNRDPTIEVFCIIGKGYLYRQFIKTDDGKNFLLWRVKESQEKFFEVACCVGGMINTITGQNFGSYLFDESNIPVLNTIELS